MSALNGFRCKYGTEWIQAPTSGIWHVVAGTGDVPMPGRMETHAPGIILACGWTIYSGGRITGYRQGRCCVTCGRIVMSLNPVVRDLNIGFKDDKMLIHE